MCIEQPSQRSDLMQDEHVVEKTNLNQFRGATKFAIGHDCKLLEKNTQISFNQDLRKLNRETVYFAEKALFSCI